MLQPNHARTRFLATVAVALSLAGSARAQFEIARPVGHDVATCSASAYAYGAVVDLDDDTLIVGAPSDVCDLPAFGAAYVFRESNGAWVEEAKLVPSGLAVGVGFGSAVAVEGNWAFASVFQLGSNSPGAGAVYVFRRSGSFPFATWSPAQLLLASNSSAGDRFGASLDIDGDTLVVGSDSVGRSGYIFRRSAGVWGEVARIDPPGDGWYDAVRLDAGTLVARRSGAAPHAVLDVFEVVGGAWGLVASFAPPEPATHGTFGYGFDVSGDTLLVGAPLAGIAPPFGPGSVYRSTREFGAWGALVRTDPDGIPSDGAFGGRVALDGETALVSARIDDFEARPVLVAYTLTPASLVELGRVRLGPLDLVGSAPPTLVLDGDFIASGTDTGVALVFSLSPPTPQRYCTAQPNSAGCLPRIGSTGTPSPTSLEPFWIEAHDVLAFRPGLVFFGRTGRTSVPFEGGTLCVLPPLRRTPLHLSTSSGATSACPGAFHYDFNALLRSNLYPDLIPGALVQAQLWYRDPLASTSTGLTDALEFGIGF